MDRFVAMVWDHTDQNQQGYFNIWSKMLERQSPKWQRVLDRPGFCIFSYHHRGDGPVVTHWQGEEGIVVGVLFERGQEEKGRVKTLDPAATRRAITSHGDELNKKYWGNYVALWRNSETRDITVLRDPCGAVSCFVTRQKGVELVFADVEDVADLPGVAFTIDWKYLQAFVYWQYFATRHTGLNEVKEVYAGQCMEIAQDSEKRFYWSWNGAEFAGSPNLQNFGSAKAELRATAEACFTAWGKEYRNVIVRLSGGVDSSIVLNLLRSVSDAQITAQHFVGAGYESYELKLARLSAARAGVKLLEPQSPNETDLRRALDFPRTMRPSLQTMSMEVDDIMVEAAESVGADSFMGGQGGDQLFLQQSSGAHALADYVRLQGVGPRFWDVAYETAMMSKDSTWKAAGNAIETALLHRAWRPYAFLEDAKFKRNRLLRQEVIDSIPDTYISHPWLAPAKRLPRGVAGRVKEIISLHEFHVRNGFAFARDDIIPLFSQPLAEFSLRTPTYVFGQDGLDRALERRAFADLMPDAVYRRTNKGATSHTVLRQWPQTIGYCREIILGGAFATQGWIDTDKASRALTVEHLAEGKGATHLCVVCRGSLGGEVERAWRARRRMIMV